MINKIGTRLARTLKVGFSIFYQGRQQWHRRHGARCVVG